MNASGHNITTFSRAWKLLGLTILVLALWGQQSNAQNTKGDRPGTNRESRFKTPFSKGKSSKRQKVVKPKRVRSSERSVASRANASSPRRRASGADRPGKPIKPVFRSEPSDKQKAWRGDIAGYKVRKRSSAGSSRNVYPQYGRYVHNPSKKPRSKETAASNRGTLARLKTLQTPDKPTPGKRRKIVPRSASSSFTARKSINVYASFPRPKRKVERATTKDLAGRPLRRRNFESPRPGVIEPTFKPYYHRKPMGDKPYSGKVQGGYRTATRPGGKAWQGDVAGRRIRGRNFSSKKSIEGQPILPTRKNKDRYGDRAYRGKHGWYQTITRSGETRPGKGPLPARTPGIGASGIEKYQGNIKGQKPVKGGGSVSGKVWNNNGQALVVRAPRQGARAAMYQGNIKAARPAKGGGSVSGRLWNNRGIPIETRTPGKGDSKGVRYQGNLRAKPPAKGGGSISGKVWNNNQSPLQRKPMPAGAGKVAGYPGKVKRFSVQPGFSDMGEAFTGYIKLKKFRKDYVENPNAVEESTKKKRPNKSTYAVGGLTSKVKRPGYTENKNSADEALLKVKPSKNTYQAGELQVRVKEKDYAKKPHAAEGSLQGVKPTKSSVKASEYARSVRRNWDYIHNPSSADEALKTREPGKAFGKSAAYQGNIKMQKFALFEKNRQLHPDTKFIKQNKNNVDEERDALTNFKLWWARMFKKQETQPEHLKYKGKKPRYDKGEEGMWNE